MDRTELHMYAERVVGRRDPEWTDDDEASLGAERQAVVDRAVALIDRAVLLNDQPLDPPLYELTASNSANSAFLTIEFPADETLQAKVEPERPNGVVMQYVSAQVFFVGLRSCEITTGFQVLDTTDASPHRIEEAEFLESTHLHRRGTRQVEAFQRERIATYGWVRIFEGMNASLAQLEALVDEMQEAQGTTQPDSVR